MKQIHTYKKNGIGSISLILSIIGVIFSFSAWNNKSLGEYILSALNISFPFPEIVLVRLISLVLLFISFFIGYKYKNHNFAKPGRIVAILFILLILFQLSIKLFFI